MKEHNPSEDYQEHSCCQEHIHPHTHCGSHKEHICCKNKKHKHNEHNQESCASRSPKENVCCETEEHICCDTEEITLENEIERLKEQLKDKEQKYLLSLAEAENSRKRLQKERQELTKYAVENILTEILYPMENLENALNFAKNMSEEVKNWALGFEMILGQFKNILSENGVIEYTAVDQMFDPYFHEAVETVETNDYPEGFIIQEFAKGYKVSDRPIRVAKVKVAKKLHQKEINETKNN